MYDFACLVTMMLAPVKYLKFLFACNCGTVAVISACAIFFSPNNFGGRIPTYITDCIYKLHQTGNQRLVQALQLHVSENLVFKTIYSMVELLLYASEK
jgi:hypothetical protein